MKRRWAIVLILTTVVALGGIILWRSGNSAQKELERVRRELTQQGFKTALTDFDFSTSPELRARMTAVTNAGQLSTIPNDAPTAHRLSLLLGQPDLTLVVGSDSAVVAWKEEKLTFGTGEDLWPVLRESVEKNRVRLDAACESLLSGPVRFHLDATAGNGMLLPHLGDLQNTARTLGKRVVLELRDQNETAAWTNLLAATRLITAFEPRPIDISHLVRCACLPIIFSTTWQALQKSDWSDDQLALLQHEWESLDLFSGLPETAAFNRAAMVDTCQKERQQPQASGITFSGVIKSPRTAWAQFSHYRQQVRYRHHGSYEDEAALLLHYRDREVELRNAIQLPTWSEMRHLPGVTNHIPFVSKHRSRTVAMLNLKQLSMAFLRQGPGILGRFAEAETRRRLLITAIALERHIARHGSYPDKLEELTPKFLSKPLPDFMDGQPLRYRLTEDGHFVLYSVGLDCTDDGGRMPQSQSISPFTSPQLKPRKSNFDLVWPRPASEEEAREFMRKAEREATLRRAEATQQSER